MDNTYEAGVKPPSAAVAGESPSGTWRAAGRSIRGSSHLRSGKPNQDALGWWPENRQGPNLVLAIADGHGSAKSFRSDRGSRFAVQVALEALTRMVGFQAALTEIKRTATEQLPADLVREWRRLVDQDIAGEPFQDEERTLLGASAGDALDSPTDYRRYVAYGSTLLAAAATPQYILLMQLGDGDILFVSKTGEVMRPLPLDSRLFANETTSLSMEDAPNNYRIEFNVRQRPGDAFSGLILLSTDGYSNSFRDEANFLKVGSDLLALVAQHGLETVESNLEAWLQEASASGSGDDVTVGLLVQAPVFEAVPADGSVVTQDLSAQAATGPPPPPIPTGPAVEPPIFPVPAPRFAGNPDPPRQDTPAISNLSASDPVRSSGVPMGDHGLSLTRKIGVPIWLAILAPVGLATMVALWLLLSRGGAFGEHGQKKMNPKRPVIASKHPGGKTDPAQTHRQPPGARSGNDLSAQAYGSAGV